MKDKIAIEARLIRKDSDEGKKLLAERAKDREWIDAKMREYGIQ